jgi:release factor glutamine methyltransferase
MGYKFYVDSRVLIPRPETELIVEWVSGLSLNKNSTIFEVGTGSGCIAISICLKNKDLKILATDLSASALEVAQINKELHNAQNVTFMQSNWLSCSMQSSLDLVISNPPYIKPNDPHLKDLNHEPLIALTAENGSQSFFQIASQAISSLKSEGKIIFEHGYSQAEEVSNILRDLGFKNIVTCKDFQGLDRYTYANK